MKKGEQMIDVHCHILPGLDDGSPDMDSSVKMAAIAANSGTRCLVATPHSNQVGRYENYYTPGLENLFHTLKTALEAKSIPLKLFLGMEIFASDDLYEKITSGMLIGLNHSHHYLVEFHFDETPVRIQKYLNDILDAGGIPLIAHPERYYCVQDCPELVYDWLSMGCLAQINKGSLFGRFGRSPQAVAETLLFNGLVTCLGSDAHSPYRRTTDMEGTHRYLIHHLGHEITWLITEENPRRILNDLPVITHGRPPGADFD